MLTLVIYDTTFGNTARIAEAIAIGAGATGSASVQDADEAIPPLGELPDLLIVGGPTQHRGPSPALRSLLDALEPSVRGAAVATFDTRYRGSTWLMGSAAGHAAKRLGKAGARLLGPPESFFVARGGPLEGQGVEAGELERAEASGREIGAAARCRHGALRIATG